MNDRQRKKSRKDAPQKTEETQVWLKMHENVTDAELDALGINHEMAYCDPRGKKGVQMIDAECNEDEIVVEFRSVAEGLTNDYRMKMKIPKDWVEEVAPERKYVAL
jgi:hypothetical protein